MKPRAGTTPLWCGEAGRERAWSRLYLLNWMLTVQIDQNYLVLFSWTCGLGTEVFTLQRSWLLSLNSGKKEKNSKANPKEAPLWEAVFTHRSVMLWSRESLSIWLSLWRESDSCTWHSSSSVIISKAASSGGLEASLATVPKKKKRKNINTVSWLFGIQTSRTLKGEAWEIPHHLQKH